MRAGCFGVLAWLWAFAAMGQTTLKVLTYNINHGRNTQDYSNLIRVGELIRTYKPDLVAFQEVDSATRRSYGRFQMEQLANLTGLKPVYVPTLALKEGSYGLGILSRYPILAVQRLDLPDPDSTGALPLLEIYIEWPAGKTIRFCTTQLDPHSFLNRGAQLAYLRQLLGRSIQPVILAGDFNTDPDDPEVEKWDAQWRDAGAQSSGPTIAGTGARTDFVWTLRGQRFEVVSYQVLDEPGTSDHFPVLVTYQLK